jgi:hypothetical protein
MSIIKISLKKIHIILLYAFGVEFYATVAKVFVKRFTEENNLFKNALYIMPFLGNTGLLFLYYIEQKRSELKVNIKKNKDNIIYINNDEDNKENTNDKIKNIIKKKQLNKTKTYILIIIIFFLRVFDLIFDYPFFNYYIELGDNKENKFKFISLMMIPFILKKKNKVYSHQFFSFILLIVSLYLDFINNPKKIEILFITLISFCKTIPDAITLNIFKFLNESEYINIYLLGSIDALAYIIDIIIIKCIKIIYFDIRLDDFKLNSLINLRFFILSILEYLKGFFFNYMTFAIIQLFDPIYTSVVALFMDIFDFNSFNLFNILSIILTFLGSLIYLEILIINCCGLGKNVKDNIFSRAKIQTKFDMDIDSISKCSNIKSIISHEIDDFETNLSQLKL